MQDIDIKKLSDNPTLNTYECLRNELLDIKPTIQGTVYIFIH